VQAREIEGVKSGADDRRFHRDVFELRAVAALIMTGVCGEFSVAGQFRQWLMPRYS
jgi:hypothetical protein